MHAQEQLRDVRRLADHVAAGPLADARGQRPPVAGALEVAQLVDRRSRCLGRLIDGAELLAARLRGADELGLESEPLHRQMQQRLEVEFPCREHHLLLQHELADRLQELLGATNERTGVLNVAAQPCKLRVESLPSDGLQGERVLLKTPLVVEHRALGGERPAQRVHVLLRLQVRAVERSVHAQGRQQLVERLRGQIPRTAPGCPTEHQNTLLLVRGAGGDVVGSSSARPKSALVSRSH